jgi:hypothetical protein
MKIILSRLTLVFYSRLSYYVVCFILCFAVDATLFCFFATMYFQGLFFAGGALA